MTHFVHIPVQRIAYWL